MRDQPKREQSGDQRRREIETSAVEHESEGGLRELLRRLVGSRSPEVYVMEPDGQLRRGRT